jgi:predicted solute-binding protein
MKENKIIEMKNKIESLTKVVQALIKEVQINASLAQGVLTAFQLHIGEEEWKKIVEELKDIESRPQPKEKKFETDVE